MGRGVAPGLGDVCGSLARRRSAAAGTSLGAGVTACVSLLSAGGGAAASSAAAAAGWKYASVRATVGAGVSVATPARPAAAAAMASRALVTWTISLAVREEAVSPLVAKPLFPAGDKRGRRAPPRRTDDE